MDYHAFSEVIKHAQIWMYEFIIELDLLFGKFVIVCVHFIDELPVEVN